MSTLEEKKITKRATRKVKPHTNLILNDGNAIVGFVKDNWDNSTINKFESAYVLYLDFEDRIIEWELLTQALLTALRYLSAGLCVKPYR